MAEFLDYKGLSRFVDKLWNKINTIFIRKDDAVSKDASIIKNMTYSDDSSTYEFINNVKAVTGTFREINLPDSSFNNIDYQLDASSGNPVANYVIAREIKDIKTTLQWCVDKINEIINRDIEVIGDSLVIADVGALSDIYYIANKLELVMAETDELEKIFTVDEDKDELVVTYPISNE